MKTIQISEEIFKTDKVFHEEFDRVMGFPGFYGENWSAWIDCMSYIDEPKEEMSKINIDKNESLEIEILIKNGNEYYKTSTWGHFTSCVAAVNRRFADEGLSTRIIITEKNVSN